jgi:hypothetical protein
MKQEIEKPSRLRASGTGLTIRLSQFSASMIGSKALYMFLDGVDLVLSGKDSGPGIRLGEYQYSASGNVRAPTLWCQQAKIKARDRVKKFIDEFEGANIIRVRKA